MQYNVAMFMVVPSSSWMGVVSFAATDGKSGLVWPLNILTAFESIPNNAYHDVTYWEWLLVARCYCLSVPTSYPIEVTFQ